MIRNWRLQLLTTVLFTAAGLSSMLFAGDIVVKNVDEFKEAVTKLEPGDNLILASGTWSDADLVFTGTGTKDAPITLKAEEPGKVILNGASRLRLGGEHLVVSGLLFTDGYTPGRAVIEFRKDSRTPANNSRVTNCAIDDYNQADRFKADSWVLMYGKNNRFDHNYLANKKNRGVTLVVILNDPMHRENNHRIDHNHFGYRPRLGSNGGETLRIGVSTYSLESSNTIVEENLFEHCNGETEVASIKSSDNIVRRNTFWECEGSLVNRHGNRNMMHDNFFIGNNKPETGGIRVINEGHKIFNNYMFGLKGDRFRAAFAVMNGVPNSLLNRYHKAENCIIANNTIIDCDNVGFGVGSDFERTDTPKNILFANNIIANKNLKSAYHKLDDLSGFSFAGNADHLGAEFKHEGFTSIDPKLEKNEHGIWVPTNTALRSAAVRKFDFVKTDITGSERRGQVTAGAIDVQNGAKVKPWATRENTGTSWYKPVSQRVTRGSGKVHQVGAEAGALEAAVMAAKPGDIIELTASATYPVEKTMVVKYPLVIRAAEGLATRPKLNYVGDSRLFSFISIENGGELLVRGLAFEGHSGGSGVAESGISTSRKPMIEHYNLFVEDCEFFDFQASRHNAFRAYPSTFADTVSFKNCIFYEISGTAIELAGEKDDRGKYSAEYVFVENCVFRNVMGAAMDLYRGGNDESTFGPFLTVNNCVFDFVNNKEQGSVLRLIGVQNADIRNSIFWKSGRGGRSIWFEESRWNHVRVHHCNIFESGKVDAFYDNVVGDGMIAVKPIFVNEVKMNYQLQSGSKLIGAGSDGGNIGLRRR